MEVSNLHSNVARNREISIAIKEEGEAEEIGKSDLGKKEECEKTKDDTAKEERKDKLTQDLEEPAFKEDKCVNGQAELDPESSSDKSGLLTTHL